MKKMIIRLAVGLTSLGVVSAAESQAAEEGRPYLTLRCPDRG